MASIQGGIIHGILWLPSLSCNLILIEHQQKVRLNTMKMIRLYKEPSHSSLPLIAE